VKGDPSLHLIPYPRERIEEYGSNSRIRTCCESFQGNKYNVYICASEKFGYNSVYYITNSLHPIFPSHYVVGDVADLRFLIIPITQTELKKT